MRIDKYLKLTRVIKRRSVAKDLLDAGFVKVNQKLAKASTTLAINDMIEITYGHKTITLKVLQIKEIVRKEEATTLYQLLQETVL
jgi:ribosomal 50S subunit-recycling heat shock protein